MKNTIGEVSIIQDRTSNRLDTAKENINDHEIQQQKNIQMKKGGGNLGWKEWRNCRISELWEDFRQLSVCAIRVSRGKEKEKTSAGKEYLNNTGYKL